MTLNLGLIIQYLQALTGSYVSTENSFTLCLLFNHKVIIAGSEMEIPIILNDD